MFISANMAITADGKISTRAYTPARFTSQRDSIRLLKLRENKDAILVGIGTLLADTMALTVPGQHPQPLRCIVSRTTTLPSSHPVLHSSGGMIHLCSTEKPTPTTHENLIHHQCSLTEFLKNLEEHYLVKTIHCEGGGTLLNEMLKLGLIDELYLTITGHTLYGGTKAPSLTGQPSAHFPQSKHFRLEEFLPTEEGECFLKYVRHT